MRDLDRDLVAGGEIVLRVADQCDLTTGMLSLDAGGAVAQGARVEAVELVGVQVGDAAAAVDGERCVAA
jgi:hypothetical protein